MSKELVPQETKTAAARGFIRTASQSLATGFATVGGITFAFTQDFAVAFGMGVAGMAVTAILNGAQSYFSILSKGIPEDYAVSNHVESPKHVE